MKTISFGKPVPATADAWVKAGSERAAPAAGGPMKHLTINMPLDLHARIKIACSQRGLTMADAIRELLEREFK